VADAMAKEKCGNSLNALIDMSTLNISNETIGWIERKEDCLFG
jgi:hypothetical protein